MTRDDLACYALPTFNLGTFIGLSMGSLTEANFDAKGLWILLFEGPAVGLLALTVFGLVALRRKPMPHLNWLPVLAGVSYLAVYFFSAAFLSLPIWTYLTVKCRR